MLPGACCILILLMLLALPHQAHAQQSDSTHWLSFTQIMEQGPKANKPVFIFFHAPWCGVCKKMRRLVFPDLKLKSYLNKNYLAGQVDVTKEKVVAKLYKINYLPTFAFLTAQGKPVLFLRGYFTSDRLLKALSYVDGGHYKNMKFEEYESR
jgi:thioredoxin-related protein